MECYVTTHHWSIRSIVSAYCLNKPQWLISFSLFKPFLFSHQLFCSILLSPSPYRQIVCFSFTLPSDVRLWRLLVHFSVCQTTPKNKEAKVYSISFVVIISTFINISPCLLHLCQDVIAEDAREGLPSCPSDPSMVTCLALADVKTHAHRYMHSCEHTTLMQRSNLSLISCYRPVASCVSSSVRCIKCTPVCVTGFLLCCCGLQNQENTYKNLLHAAVCLNSPAAACATISRLVTIVVF